MKKKTLTLADCTIPIPLICLHCDKRLPKKAPIQVDSDSVIVWCPKCGCMTPFHLEKTA